MKTARSNPMPATATTMKVAVCVMGDGSITYTLPDSTSINTALVQWKKRLDGEKWQEYQDEKVMGGVVVITMLCAEYFALPKEFKPYA